MAIRCLTSYKKFNDVLHTTEHGSKSLVRKMLQREQETDVSMRRKALYAAQNENVLLNLNEARTQNDDKDKRNGSATALNIYYLEEKTGLVFEYASLT